MQVLIEGGNKTRAGSINVTTLPRSCVHCTSKQFQCEIKKIANRPELAVPYDRSIVRSQYE